jgi:hypothetical protein
MFAYLGKVLKTEITKNKDTNQNVLIATVETTKGNNRTCEIYFDDNVESRPIKDDLLIVLPFANSQGNLVAVGAKSNIVPTKNEGEYKASSRDASGTVKSFLELLNTGNVNIENTQGKVLIEDNGNITFNNGTESYLLGDSFETAMTTMVNALISHLHDVVGVQSGSSTITSSVSTQLAGLQNPVTGNLSTKIKGA